jgi:hypothetical protein
MRVKVELDKETTLSIRMANEGTITHYDLEEPVEWVTDESGELMWFGEQSGTWEFLLHISNTGWVAENNSEAAVPRQEAVRNHRRGVGREGSPETLHNRVDAGRERWIHVGVRRRNSSLLDHSGVHPRLLRALPPL